MPRSKNPAWLLDPERLAAATIDVVEFTSEDRINLPARLTGNLKWFESSNKNAQIVSLVRLDEPGRLSLLSWTEHGAVVLKRRQDLQEEAADDAEAAEAFLALAYRCQ